MENFVYKIDAQDLLKCIDFESFYANCGVKIVRSRGNERDCLCPFHDDENPSFGFDVTNGLWTCLACGESGNIFQFYMKLRGCDFRSAVEQIAESIGYRPTNSGTIKKNQEIKPTTAVKSDKPAPIVPEEYIQKAHEALLSNKEALAFLKEKRGWTLDTIKRFQLGYAEHRVIIPIRGEQGQAFNVRKYSPTHRGEKFYNYAKGYGDARFFPVENLQHDEIVLFEGEPDCILACQMGINGLTQTAGCSTWKPEWNPLFKDKKVIICYDTDSPGMKGANTVADALAPVAKEVKIVTLPLMNDGKDFSDWVLHYGGTMEQFRELMNEAPVIEASKLGPRLHIVPGGKSNSQAEIEAGEAWAQFEQALEVYTEKKDPSIFYNPEFIEVLAAIGQISELDLARAIEKLKMARPRVKTKAIEKQVYLLLRRNSKKMLISEILPDTPIVEGAVMPPNYFIDSDFSIITHDGVVSPVPIFITSRDVNIDFETEKLTVIWKRDNAWKNLTIDRNIVASSYKIVELANYGFPVGSGNAKILSQYLLDFESANMNILPVQKTASNLGWQGENGKFGFLLGEQLIGTSDEAMVKFSATDQGNLQAINAVKSSGTLEKWINAIRSLTAYPKALVNVYASFAAPLLEIIKCPNFIVDLSGRTSSGKTTALIAAASVWGCPDPREQATLVNSWDCTKVSLERIAGLFDDLAIFLDETKTTKRLEDAARGIYQLVSGHGRSRGSTRGLQAVMNWRTIIFTTGEFSIVNISQDGGTRARTLTLRGSPFGDTDNNTRMIVEKLERDLTKNYGTAGPKFIQYICSRRDKWEDWQREFQAKSDEFAQKYGKSDSAAGRACSYLAAIDLAARLAHEALNLPWRYENTVEPLAPDLLAGASEADRSLEALKNVLSWAQAREKYFWGRHDDEKTPNDGWLGRWDKEPNWKFLAFFPDKLRKALKDLGFTPEEILDQWSQAGFLESSKSKHGYCRQMRVAGGLAWLISIRRDAFKFEDETLETAESTETLEGVTNFDYNDDGDIF